MENAIKGGYKPCNTCPSYEITDNAKEGLITAICTKYNMRTEIKPNKILFCPQDKLEQEQKTVHVYDCPVCGYPVGFYRNEENGKLKGKCNVCGYEREVTK